MCMTRKISGPPGTGKTTTIIEAIDHMLKSGVQPEEIAFVSLTNKSINVAIERVRTKFGDEIAARCVNFKTLHSFTTMYAKPAGTIMSLDMYNDHLLNAMKMRGFMKAKNRLCWHNPEEDHPRRDWTLEANQFHKTIETDWETGYNAYIELRGWDPKSELMDYAKTVHEMVTAWKMLNGGLEFEDVIENFNNDPSLCPAFHAIFVDEAQDLTPNQWTTVKLLQDKTENMLIFGDVNQSIFGFAGVDYQRYLDFPADETHVLNKTWRFGDTIRLIALDKLGNANLEPDAEYVAAAAINGHYKKKALDYKKMQADIMRRLRKYKEANKTVMILSNKKKNLPPIKSNEWLTVSTVHKAKGGEADVVLYINPFELSGWDGAELARIEYVARTRARKVLVEYI